MQLIHDFGCGLDADIGAQQAGFEFIQRIAVDSFLAEEQIRHAVAEAATGFGQTGRKIFAAI